METWYRMDMRDRLLEVGPGWDDFARQNGGTRALKECILGLSIFDFISDAETCHLHQKLLARARAGHEIKNLPFRCDSPECRRYMEMDIVDLRDGMVEYRCRTVRIEEREPVRAVHVAGTSKDFLRMCSWCNKVDDGEDWKEIEDAVASLGLFAREGGYMITHTMCDACFKRLYGEDD